MRKAASTLGQSALGQRKRSQASQEHRANEQMTRWMGVGTYQGGNSTLRYKFIRVQQSLESLVFKPASGYDLHRLKRARGALGIARTINRWVSELPCELVRANFS